jgi:Tfp pilus assembly protein PilF
MTKYFGFVFVLTLLSLVATGQTCIQKYDSVELYKHSYPEKAKFYANALLVDLDSGRCVEEIGLAALYNNIGLLFWELNDRKRSVNSLLAGLKHELVNKDSIHKDLLGLYYNLSTINQETGDFETSGRYLNLAERVVTKWYLNNHEAQTRFLLNKGIYYRETGDFEKSLAALNEAVSFIGQENDSIRITLQIELGTTYRHFGDLEHGEEELISAVELAQGNHEWLYFQAIDRLSSLKIEQGDYSDSENYLLHNLERKREIYGDQPDEMLETLNELGYLYYRLNDLESAESYMDQALETGKDLRNIRPYMLNNLGAIYMKKGNLEKAEECFTESSEGFKALYGTMNPDYASSLNNLAGILKEKGELGESLNLYTRVLDMDKVLSGANHPNYATSLNNVALLYMQLGNYSLSGKLLMQSKQIREKALGRYHPLYIKSLNDLGIYHLLMKDSVAAMDVFNEALDSEIKHMQDVFPVLTDRQRKLYFDETRYNIERFCSLAFSESFFSGQYAEDALNHFLNTKGILFYASEKMKKLIQGSGDEKVVNMYNDWRDKKYRLAQAYLLTEEERIRQNISISLLEAESAQLEKELSLSFKIFSDQEKSSYHTWNELSEVMKEGSAMVDIIQFRNYSVEVKDKQLKQGFEERERYAAFVVKPGDVLETVTWPTQTDFAKAFSLYKNALQFGVQDVNSYNVFWKPIGAHLKDVKTIYFSPDGLFHKLNPVIFFDSDRDMYIADEYDLIHITSGKDLLYSEDTKFVRDAKIFGNPNFGRLAENHKLLQLPGAEREANDITGILDVRKWKSDTYYFNDATEGQMKRLSNPGLIHIATHGYFNDDPNHVDPLHSSGIYLSRDETSDNDGLLSAYEAMNLVLDQTSLIVLAACETGLGTVKNGEGVFGLQRAFLVAGAKNILLSLVKINDNAARRFMNIYYQELLSLEDPQDAFFSARRLFRKEYDNPYDWGAYILVSKNF